MIRIARHLPVVVATLVAALCANAQAAAPLGQITEFPTHLEPFNGRGLVTVQDTAAGPDGNVWFTDPLKAAIGRMTPSGQITEFSAGLPASSRPKDITGSAQRRHCDGLRRGRVVHDQFSRRRRPHHARRQDHGVPHSSLR
jgi:streptogramin lyase